MKLLCKTSELLSALQLVGHAIGGQQALPILGNILIEAEGKRCRLSATDLELSITTSIEASIENEGTITIPSKAILNFAQYNGDQEVLLESIEGTQLRCTSPHTKTMIAGEDASEFPSISPMNRQTSLSFDGSSFLEGIHLTAFAAAKSSLRPVLSGVFFRMEKERIILVATDSYRLSEYVVATERKGEEISCIIPVKVLEELKVALGGKKGEKKEEQKVVQVNLNGQQVEFQVTHTNFLSRLIEGRFPNYEQIIPKERITKIRCSVKDLTTTVRRMHYFAKEMNNILTFYFTKGTMRLVSPQTQVGKEESTLTAEIEGAENKIALSSSYLLDFLARTDSPEVEIEITDGVHPAVFFIPGNKNFLHLIMPLRMSE